jgi:hypothetical protein
MTLLAERTFRIGVEALWWHEGRRCYIVTIRNRTYSSAVEIPADRVPYWLELLA